AKNIEDLITGNEKLLHELGVSNRLRELEKDMISAESKIRGAVAANDISYLEGVELQITEAKEFLNSLRKISNDDSTRRHINRLTQLADEKLRLKNQVQDSFHRAGWLSAQSFRMMMPRREISGEVNDISRRIYNSRQRLQDSLSVSVSNSGRNARRWGTTLIILVLVTGAGLFWFIINRIRRQNHLIQRLDSSEKKVREASLVKENFMANMSHEIRTPMNAIIGFTNLLKTRNRDPQLAELVESIRKSGENLLAIINDILDLSKIEAGMLSMESMPFSIRALVHSIQTLFAEKVNEKRLLFTVAIDDNIPDTLLGDATRLTQILVNMIGNAVKFTPRGKIQLAINNSGQAGNHIRLGFVISDTGIGIAPEKLPGIFERFRQAEDSITRNYGGTGLGLSIAKNLVQMQK
ncbi:MAG TPA: histidine kinase dimerization/phospho-acceptor domain-containing protein, partial [Chitinophagaceae bacterium]|nr:histidine kinase dimerization/phospho-acceptor domain-containing protein [Chitinophagaceae bacterium]